MDGRRAAGRQAGPRRDRTHPDRLGLQCGREHAYEFQSILIGTAHRHAERLGWQIHGAHELVGGRIRIARGEVERLNGLAGRRDQLEPCRGEGAEQVRTSGLIFTEDRPAVDGEQALMLGPATQFDEAEVGQLQGAVSHH